MAVTIPYSVRIPKELLEEMKKHFDRMDPPKPTFSAVLTHIVKLGWEAYREQAPQGQQRPPERILATYPKVFRG